MSTSTQSAIDISNNLLAKTYQKKTDREHIIDAPDTYLQTCIKWMLPRLTFRYVYNGCSRDSPSDMCTGCIKIHVPF